MTAVDQIPTAFDAAPTIVEADITCRKCGYNLRGLRTDGRCPECGSSVAYSVRGDFIRYSDPDWAAGLRKGVYLILGGVVTIIAVVVLAALLGSRATGTASKPDLVMIIGAILSQGLILVGTWKLTEPDPSGVGEDQYGKVRRFIRIALLVNLAGALLNVAPMFAPVPSPFLQMLTVVQALTTLVGLAGFCCQLIYLGRLALRLPDDAIARKAKSIAWMIGVSYGVVIVFSIVVPMLIAATSRPGGRPGSVLMIAGLVIAVFGIVLLIGGIRYLLLIERFAKRLKAEEEMARQTWAQAR